MRHTCPFRNDRLAPALEPIVVASICESYRTPELETGEDPLMEIEPTSAPYANATRADDEDEKAPCKLVVKAPAVFRIEISKVPPAPPNALTSPNAELVELRRCKRSPRELVVKRLPSSRKVPAERLNQLARFPASTRTSSAARKLTAFQVGIHDVANEPRSHCANLTSPETPSDKAPAEGKKVNVRRKGSAPIPDTIAEATPDNAIDPEP